MTEPEPAANRALDLKSDEGLREACRRAEAAMDPERIRTLADYLKRVHEFPAEERSSKAFHELVWLDETIWQPAPGDERQRLRRRVRNAASMRATFWYREFRTWFAKRIAELLADEESSPTKQSTYLESLYQTVRNRFVPDRRKPIFTILRGMLAVFPHDMAGLVGRQRIETLFRAVGLPPTPTVKAHCRMAERLNQVAGPVDRSDWDAVATRIELPTRLFEMIPRVDADPKPAPNGDGETPQEPGSRERPVPSPPPAPSGRARSWLLALGEKSEEWDSCRRGGVATLGWRDAGDLRRYASKKDIRDKVDSAANALACWQFSRDMKPGDTIFVKMGTKRVQGYGIVRSDYRFERERKNQPNVRDVDWLSNLGREGAVVDFGPLAKKAFPQKTLTDITKREAMLRQIRDALGIQAVPILRPLSLSTIAGSFERLREAEEPLRFPAELVETLHTGLWTDERRHFAVLTGLSGAGKTRLALEYARTITGGDRNAAVTITVQPGWHDPAHLLGHVNPLKAEEYFGTPFLNLLLRAKDRPKTPHVAILDEMNLSHVEQYLAPVLSAMETGDALSLHESDAITDVPPRLPYPSNLVLIGTVNMDETTVGISDKVLDRAFTLEFWDIEVEEWAGWDGCRLNDKDREVVRGVLDDLMAALKPARLHFGWRVIREVVRFVERSISDEIARDKALDRVVYAKVLPKLRGDDSERFRMALKACRKALEKHGLMKCRSKVKEMKSDLDETGSVRFWR